MAARSPLPSALASAPFTVPELIAAGLPWDRTRAADLTRIVHGVYMMASPSTPAGVGTEEPGHGPPWTTSPAVAAALCRLTGGVLSHASAAAWHGMPLPSRLERDPGLHLTFDRNVRTHRTELAGVVSHRLRLPADHVLHPPDGLRVTTPERTWADLAGVLRPFEADWLVAVADHLVRSPWREGRRRAPISSIAALTRLLAACRGRPGIRRARAALEAARVGADSPQETFLRLALVRAGLPEPELQLVVDPDDPWSPAVDLGYRAARLALQYDGAGHRTPEQQARDARREAYCLERDWFPLRCTWEDQRAGFGRVVASVRRRLAVATHTPRNAG